VCLVCGGAQQVRQEQRTLTKAIDKLDVLRCRWLTQGFEDAKSEVVEYGAGKECRDRVDADG
jgi:hypothetical protein